MKSENSKNDQNFAKKSIFGKVGFEDEILSGKKGRESVGRWFRVTVGSLFLSLTGSVSASNTPLLPRGTGGGRIEPAGPEPPPAHSLGRVGEDAMGRSGQWVFVFLSRSAINFVPFF